jgi:predicted Zn-ribbon and HTH transcriptional regulator
MVAERCSKCDSEDVVYFVYGYPSEEMVERSLRGDVVVSGSMVWPEAPNRACQQCGYEWRSKKEARPRA